MLYSFLFFQHWQIREKQAEQASPSIKYTQYRQNNNENPFPAFQKIYTIQRLHQLVVQISIVTILSSSNIKIVMKIADFIHYLSKYKLLLYLMKSAGTRSTQLIRKKYDNRLNQLTQIANTKGQELLTLKSKISSSKPLLQSIYHKFKLRQSNLQSQLNDSQKKNFNMEEKVKRSTIMHKQTVKIMKQMGMQGLYDGYDNYPTGSTKYTPTKWQREEYMKSRLEREREAMPLQPPKPIKTQNIYEQYQQKLRIARNNNDSIDQAVKNTSRLKQKLQKVAKDLKDGLDVIKSVKKQFKYLEGSLNKTKFKISQSETRFKIKPSSLQPPQQSKFMIDRERASKYIENKQKWLYQQRNRQ